MKKNFNRRTMLKTTGAAAAFTGFSLSAPNVLRANDKVVRYLGTATTMGGFYYSSGISRSPRNVR